MCVFLTVILSQIPKASPFRPLKLFLFFVNYFKVSYLITIKSREIFWMLTIILYTKNTYILCDLGAQTYGHYHVYSSVDTDQESSLFIATSTV